MIKNKKVHHPNDVTNTYLTNVIPEILHRYFNLPGKFVRNYTTKIVKRDGSEGQMDWLTIINSILNIITILIWIKERLEKRD